MISILVNPFNDRTGPEGLTDWAHFSFDLGDKFVELVLGDAIDVDFEVKGDVIEPPLWVHCPSAFDIGDEFAHLLSALLEEEFEAASGAGSVCHEESVGWCWSGSGASGQNDAFAVFVSAEPLNATDKFDFSF